MSSPPDSAGPRVGVDFFAHGGLPVPLVSVEEAVGLAASSFGMKVSAFPLGSQQDCNFLLQDDGGPAGVLKIANPAFSRTEIEAQDAAAGLVAGSGLRAGVATHGPVVVTAGGGPALARVLRYLPGGTLTGAGYLAPRVVAELGAVAGRVSRALGGFGHPGLDRVLQWDLRHADRLVGVLAEYVRDPGLRARVIEVAGAAWRSVEPLAGELPVQAIHGDVTDDNVVCSVAGGLRTPDGVIDFGDLTSSWAVGELAVAITSVLRHAGAEPCSVLPAVRAFHAVRPLSAAEAAVLWPLVLMRAAVLVVSGEQQAVLDGGNEYVNGALEHERACFEAAASVPAEIMTTLITNGVGFPRPPLCVSPGTAGVDLGRCVVLDLSVRSDAVDEGAWLSPGLADRLALALLDGEGLDGGADAVVTRYGEARLDASRVLAEVSPATVATGIDLWVARPCELGAVTAGEGLELTLSCPGSLVPARAAVHVGVRVAGAPEVPPLVRPEYAAGWLALTADPGPLLGLATETPVADGDLLARREAAFADVQEHYYADPPRIERGWRQHLAGVDGRVYLDMVNNVAAIGHAHPRLEAAVTRQLRRLNTNSRFHYAAVAEFAERLAALLPSPLDTVFLVNSGSEAVDLALRLAFVTTGRQDVVAVREAYHGWTYASDAVSTSTADNPSALATRPGWVHAVDAPNAYRGRYRGDLASRYAADAVALVDSLAASGRPPAAFVAEPFYGNAGGMALPDGYLAAVYAEVRRHGGLAIADEIQVGYGRLGHWFWGFEQQGVVPDVVTVAKAMGNGHPLGAVITSRSVAARYRDAGYFFSSTGGSPVSCVAGLAVLDVIESEGLQANAALAGSYLKGRLEELAGRHALIGAVHGAGLYLGVEFVRDRDTLEPAAEETMAVCDRLRELGVIMQPTSDRMCVLKIKPPLCLDVAGADFFADALDRVLTEGW
ncbi:MAG TPA: aminotransferase class III-fold pyridoxal phosphate-dependent enzyme [Streptosporangiaceae bacterium]|nr:aminotransferase class III-fold pyridoxal phosphate-dependent enzyme [Streptosporangiaceae bacterium]